MVAPDSAPSDSLPRVFRASDEDRDDVIRMLREGSAAGRISNETFLQRVDRALRAQGVDELAELLSDLPPAPSAGPVASAVRDWWARITTRLRDARFRPPRLRGVLLPPRLPRLILPRGPRTVFTIGRSAISGNDAWASGSEGNVNGQNFHVPYVEHWNGTAWSLVKTPNRGGEGSLLNGITALGASDIWAVGQTQQLNGAITPLTEQFNGTAWSVVPSPAPGSSGRIPDDSLTGAAGLTGGLVFAVGARDVPGQCCLRTLGLRTTAG